MRFVIAGQVLRGTQPLVGVTVTFADGDPGTKGDAVLGVVTTGEDGRYRWTHSRDLKADTAGVIQVLVTVGDAGAPLVRATAVLDKPAQTVNLTVAVADEEQSEFERVDEALRFLYPDQIPEVLTVEQVQEVAQQSGVDAGAVAAYIGARAHRGGQTDVPVEAYYALLRQGHLRRLGDIGQQPLDVGAALKGAVERGIVPARLIDQLAPIASGIGSMEEQARVVMASRLAGSIPASLPAKLRKRLQDRLRKHTGSIPDLWHSLKDDPDFQAQEPHSEVPFVLKLAEVVGGNLSLVEALQVKRLPGEHPAMAMAQFSLDEWAATVRASLANGESIPDHIPGEKPAEREERYIARVVESFAAAFPTQMVAAALKRAAPALADAGQTGVIHNPVRAAAVRFFDQAPDFDLSFTQVDQFVQQQGERALAGIAEEEREPVVTFLKGLQRTFQVTPKYDQIQALLGEGLDSAPAISGMGADAFIARMGERLGGEATARQVHARARFVTAVTANLFATVHQAMNDVTPMALGGPSQAAALREQLPTWNSLFGRTDLCDCPHCRSVYSPAAYLADLLHYLAPSEPPLGYTLDSVPVDFLRRRRPDIEQLLLTCENTNTPVPYVDLVNEVLESYMATGAVVVNNTSASATGESLSVNREYSTSFAETISDTAYARVASAVFPFTLPYDRNIAVARSFIEHLGSSRYELIKTFRRPGWREREAVESLGLSPVDRDIFREQTGRSLWELYGYAAGYVDTPGLLGRYYATTTLSGAAFARQDAAVSFNWQSGSPAPAVPIDNFSVRWEAKFVAPATGAFTFYARTDDGVRLYVNGTLLIDKWFDQGAVDEWSAAIQLQQGTTCDLRMEFYEHGGAAQAWLRWSGPNFAKQTLGADVLFARQYWTDDVKWIPTFLNRTGLTFADLMDLLATRYVNPNPNAPWVKIQFQGDPTNLDTSYLEGLTLAGDFPLQRIHRFLRLWRRTGGTMADLDRALFSLGRKRRRFLRRYADARRLQAEVAQSFGTDLPMQALLSLWSDLDTFGPDAYYRSLFQNKAVFSPLDADFALNADRTDPVGRAATINSKVPVLVAALRLTPSELDTIRAGTGLAGNQTITLAHLSLLQRHALLARTLRLSVSEVILLKQLANVDPFANPDQTVKFIAMVKGMRSAGFSVGMLQYLLIGAAPGAGLAPTAAAISTLRNTLQAGLERLHQESTPPQNPSNPQLRELLSALLAPQDLARTLQLTEGAAAGTDAGNSAFIATRLAFLPQPEAQALLLTALPPAADPEQSRLQRRAFIAIHAAVAIQKTGSRTLVLRTLAETLGLTEAMAALLTEAILQSVAAGPAERAIADLMAPAGAAFVPAFHRLHKVALLIKALRLTTDEVAYVQANGADFAGLNFNALPAEAPISPFAAELLFGHWDHLRMLAAVQRDLPASDTALTQVFQTARAAGSTLERVLAVLARVTGWELQTLTLVCGPDGLGLTPGQFRNAAHLEQVRAALALVARTGVPAAALMGWGTAPASATQARSVRATVKARYDEATWLQVAASISEHLRGQQRDALVAYTLTLPSIRTAAVRNADQLFEYFLLDTQMNPGARTTRIKQAISAVQLFVQRCFLSLEPGVPLYLLDREIWEWLKSYRVWEANRKVFLYPENWIEPDLRQDKTPLFKQLENDLLQGEVSDEKAEAALRKYLEGMVELSRLEIVSVGSEYGDWHYGGRNFDVIGRTVTSPRVYYHRRYVNGVWQSWERLDLDIQGDHLFMWRDSSLHLYWPIFEKMTDPVNGPVPQSQTPRYRWQIKLAFSEFKYGKWTPKRVLDQALSTWYIDDHTWTQPDLTRVESINFRAIQSSTSVNGRSVPAFLITASAWRAETSEDNFRDIGMFIIHKGHSDVQVQTSSWVYYMDMPQRSRFHYSQLKAETASQLVVPTRNRFYWETATPYTTVLRKAEPYRLAYVSLWGLTLHQREPFVYQDSERTYLAAPVLENERDRKFLNLFHPFGQQLLLAITGGSVSDFYRNTLYYQRLSNDTAGPGSQFNSLYGPTEAVLLPYPQEAVDFSFGGAYAVYNWELFFHVPFLIATQLSKEQRFEEAQRWFHFIFNPTVNSSEPIPQRYWRFLPFHDNPEDERITRLLTALADPNADPALKAEAEKQVAQWQEHPFDPHLIGRLRYSSYQKAVVMKYLDNLIAWADYLYGQNTLEAINQATQLYVLAASLLGTRPEQIPELAVPLPRSFAQLRPGLDEFANALAEVQNRFPFVVSGSGSGGSGGATGLGLGLSLYFGIPKNDKLLGYWDTVADRLYKIRQGLSLEGVQQRLPLFDSALDPALLVRASAAGVTLANALSDLNAPTGHYRFGYMLSKAIEFSQEVKSLGAALLAALEKKDAEALAALRASQESSLLQLARDVRVQGIRDAQSALDGLRKTRAVVETRYNHYLNLAFLNPFEQAHLGLTAGAGLLQAASQTSDLAASVSRMIPEIDLGASGISSPVVKARFGGSNLAGALEAFSKYLNIGATLRHTGASLSATMGGHHRRAEDWGLQKDLALRELAQIDQQMLTQQIRIAVAELELRNHDKQVENARTAEQFLQDKYTNQELYGWMVSQTSGLYFQAYQLAYNMAKRAEKAFRFERGLTASNYVQFGHWDSLKKGLLAGERLLLDLRRLEMAHLDQNAREYEVTKRISLMLHDPLALIALKQTGRCEFRLPEALFDMDYSGQYFRRIKGVTVTIPCVTGPYTGIHGTLTLLSSEIRVSNTATGTYGRGDEDNRFLVDFSAVQSIATSHAQDDSGLFELSFRDERYLPFEGAGAVSYWRLELPIHANAFDYDTLSDVVITLRYTSREGGALLGTAAITALTLPEPGQQRPSQPLVALPAQNALQRMFSLRHEYPSEWHRFMSPSEAEPAHAVALPITRERFPYQFRGRTAVVGQVEAFLLLRDGVTYSGAPLKLSLQPAGSPTPEAAELVSLPAFCGGTPHATISGQGRSWGPWHLAVQRADLAAVDATMREVDAGSGQYRLKADAIEDLVLVFHYATA